MKFDIFQMERNQTLFENDVEINLTESGVHPWSIEDILGEQAARDLLKQPLGYGWTDGRPDLRANIASWYANPTGSVLSAASRAALVEAAKRNDAWLMVDEIYRGGEIEGAETETLWGSYPKVVVTSSLSKSFACPGLRLGWIVAPDEVVASAAERQDYTTIGSGILSQILAEEVMRPETRGRLLARGRDLLRGNADLVAQWMAQHNDWSWRRPQAGGMAFLRYPLDMSSEVFSQKLREEESVFVVAGSWFGIENHIRIGIGVPTEVLRDGLARMDRFLARHKG
ncbi:MAG: aminotransferase class I/II-fold pyridoxal phosphate-dependent enzyme [Hyphomicrobiales bacterium]|nr:MAG: aminotransferase class I/II-fold pyridoxal phosphate-dependent enzyme [Hyphomicrobiales bacterium]